MKLSELIQQSEFESLEQEAILNLMATNSWLVSEMSAAMAEYEITPVQYNVLRILRGSHPEKLTCSEIGDRLLDRTPDVTRLLDRLERAGLIGRERADHDRRIVQVSISQKGLDLLNEMNDDLVGSQRRITRHLSQDQLRQLSALLELLRADQ